MYNATRSVAGFLLRISVENPGIAHIVDVQFPDYGHRESGVELTRVIGQVPAESVTIAAVDLSGVLAGPFSRKVLASVNVRLLSPGETELSLSEVGGLDDVSGDPLDPELVPAVLTVAPAN